MRFWDSSAIVPLLCREEASPAIQRLYGQDSDLLVWVLTRTEILSALCRRLREMSMTREDLASAKLRLRSLQMDWTELGDYQRIRDRAERLLEVHPLSAGDALQLATALVFVDERPRDFGFVSLDRRLMEAAAKEGFSVADV